MERQKVEVIAVKQQKNRGDISLSNENDDNYYSDIDNRNPDQKDKLNLVQGRNGRGELETIWIEF